MAKDANISKAQAQSALDSFINTTTKALKKGDRVALVGFGSFSVSQRSSRSGRNPQTGREIKIAAKKVVKFKAGAALGNAVK
jgi:DNA-binding protein HU-beta